MGVIEPMLKKNVLANNRPIVSHSQNIFKGVDKLLGCRLEVVYLKNFNQVSRIYDSIETVYELPSYGL